MEGKREQFAAAGCGLVVVSQGTAGMLTTFLKWNPKAYPVVGDAARALYTAFGLERASLADFLRPSVLWGYLRATLRLTRPRLPYVGEDVTQLGGDFILDRAGHDLFAHRSKTPTDRPSPKQLLAALPAGI